MKPQIKGQSPLLRAFSAELRNENFFSHPAAKLQEECFQRFILGSLRGVTPQMRDFFRSLLDL
ncbi:MAG: hypothetical protein AMJ45_02955 [Syntrophobacter sp. DG_60]|nr:MAG: hypothetical protein AMJ45_02955 [Syntrophobacter sp. DG_60]